MNNRRLRMMMVIISATRNVRPQWTRPFLKSLYKRRLAQGPEPEKPRSAKPNWNYDAEIYAFGKRLGEEFKSSTLKRAFITQSYIEKEKGERVRLGLEDDTTPLQLDNNEELINLGSKVASEYIQLYSKRCFPRIPQDGIQSVTSHLLSNEILAHVASNLGVKDLVQTAEFPVSMDTLSDAFRAVVGALHHDQGQEKAELFIQDFILTQLIGKDILDLCAIKNPMGLLTDILQDKGLPEPEPRLLWSTGCKTILASYVVGIYCNKQLIGRGPGETASIGEEMAARDALRRLFQVANSKTPLPIGHLGRSMLSMVQK